MSTFNRCVASCTIAFIFMLLCNTRTPAAEMDAQTAWKELKRVPSIAQDIPCLNFTLGELQKRTPNDDVMQKAGVIDITESPDHKLLATLSKPADGKSVKVLNKTAACLYAYSIDNADLSIVRTEEIKKADGTRRLVVFLRIGLRFSDLFRKAHDAGYPGIGHEPLELNYELLFEENPFGGEWYLIVFDRLYPHGTYHTNNVADALERRRSPPFPFYSFISQIRIVGFESGFMAQGPIAGNFVQNVALLGEGYSPDSNMYIVYAGITTKNNNYYVVRSDCVQGTTKDKSWYCSKPVSAQDVLVVRSNH